MSFLVSVIIPVYNGEKYLQETLESVKNQAYSNIEVLFIDDSSTDSSLSILNAFAANDNRFKVFKKERGGMVPKTMNFIKPHINGDCFYYSSQDDIFSEDLIKSMVEKQIQTQADTVLPDMEFYHENNPENKTIVGLNGNRNIELTGKEALIASLDWAIHGFALFKTSLLEGVYFPEDAFDSDEYITRKLFLKSNKVVFSEGCFFYRQDNKNAITKTFSAKNIYTLNTAKKMYDLLDENDVPKEYVFQAQQTLLGNHFGFSAIHSFFNFKSNIEKEKTRDFLIDFKKNVFTNAFVFQNLNYVITRLKLKYMIFSMVYSITFLFDLVKPVYSMYIKIKWERKLNVSHQND
ncbi:glycosyltransferase family 2 protein [Tamlana crocina]|uniref:Glycosyltransferase family 2 protein n=1 Tax=Tamlana crocina TaxID=393006 RepID=A0ABX1DBV9_9FLAO|nr:glycosyltransferase [Tamlana crocina]NJX14691.1 glycosyltransferase family 2 protein [Tamlana crocina]